MTVSATHQQVMSCADAGLPVLQQLLAPYELEVVLIEEPAPLPGSFWGDPEAGLIGWQLFIRSHTPLQSALHEASHYICMDSLRRARLHTDAGGGYDEENAVCYLQILLADQLPGVGRQRMWQDMDRWGYTFRLGSAQCWFEQDAEDTCRWLLEQDLIDRHEHPTGRLRQGG
ncbi:hypothetical protein [Thiohalophilus sp.]|uniref:hypothetical protein n=1 Tax=Thiohalophilus sp. TaxID=3028392 RepID=UPI002ACDC9F0|nr:hypothetical protein [Thiohalophilus sp.]MDZ7662014.1 hypothetical protein [Thiohalophilus sp.]